MRPEGKHRAVDATGAPILFANSVGGYMPSSVADATGDGGAAMTGMSGGGTGDGGVESGGGGVESGGDDVNALMCWDGGHGANEDAADFIQLWIGKVTGHTT